MAPNPYESLPPDAFWRLAVATRRPEDIRGLWRPKFPVAPTSRIATFGSCFAQHFGRALRERGYNWLNTEPAPFGLSPHQQKTYHYGTFTCRTTNIYTATQLRQWTELALGHRPPPDEVWSGPDGFRDPLRPMVEPQGFSSEAELHASRRQVLDSFAEAIGKADVFVFTMGLTESWVNADTGLEYQSCPGTSGGTFDPARHRFVNQDHGTILVALTETIKLMRAVNRRLKFLFTVSPVPLTATMSGHHVLVATMMSKSILRAVCAKLTERRPFADYFPSYEIISAPPFRGRFFEENLRSVTPEGVDLVMRTFFEGLNPTETGESRRLMPDNPIAAEISEQELVCEDLVLEGFAPKSAP